MSLAGLHALFRVCSFWVVPGAAALLLVSGRVEANPHALGTAATRSRVPAPASHPFDPDWLAIKRMIDTKCFACHRPGTERSDLTSYESLLAAAVDGDPSMRVVVPGKPEESILWEYVAWNARADTASYLPDSPMMPSGDSVEWLTAGQLDTIKRWIRNGALEYKLPKTCNTRPLLETDFPSAHNCKQCHPKQYAEWSRSMHAYAQHSPTFEAFNLTIIERTGGTIGTFCSRCHTPIGTALGENGSLRNVHRSRISMEGVTCVVCHRRPAGQYKASGRVAIEPGGVLEGCVYGPFQSSVSRQVNSHASKHLSYIRSSQFCGECHDVTNPQGVRLEEAYSEWANSPAAKKGVTCQMCHMGPVQGVAIPCEHRPLGRAAVVPGIPAERIPLRRLSDHTFAGPDYSLLPDTEFPEKRDWMYEVDYTDASKLTPYQMKSLIDLRRHNREQLRIADQKRYELLHNAADLIVRAPREAACGRSLRVHVDVHNKVAGHSLPTGFTAERQIWVSVELFNPQGRRVFASGDLDHNGDLRDEHSHQVLAGRIPRDKYLLNFQNKFVALTFKGTERSVVLPVNRDVIPVSVVRPAAGVSASFGRPASFRIAKGALPPLGTIGKSYPIPLPLCAGDYLLRVRLNFRHLPPTLLDHIGMSSSKHLLEVVVLDAHESVVRVTQTPRQARR